MRVAPVFSIKWSLAGWLVDGTILLGATAGTYVAAGWGRPVTAVLVYLTGVILIGARSGLARGMMAALLASIIYNFFLSEPRFQFGVTSTDELVPLIAFNLSAFISGGLAGRLKDSAKAARAAEARNALLLAISDDLQRALTLKDVGRIAGETFPLHQVPVGSLSIWKDGPPLQGENGAQTVLVAPLSQPDYETDHQLCIELTGSTGWAGKVSFARIGRSSSDAALADLRAVANLLAMAIDRCLLLERLSEATVSERSEKLKSALLSSVSHDLRTPLTAIEAAATSLRSYRDNLSPQQQDHMLSTIADQCGKLNRYTANLLDMGRIQAGIPRDRFGHVDVVEILGVALAVLRARFPGQAFEKRVQSGAALVLASAPMLEQVLVNILENAVLHGGGGKPISVTLTQNDQSVELAVIDNGPGVLDAQKAKVFERFYRGAEAIQREGSGLGLYIARGFIEAFGGTVEINRPEQTDAKGTRVSIRLPLVRGEANCKS